MNIKNIPFLVVLCAALCAPSATEAESLPIASPSSVTTDINELLEKAIEFEQYRQRRELTDQILQRVVAIEESEAALKREIEETPDFSRLPQLKAQRARVEQLRLMFDSVCKYSEGQRFADMRGSNLNLICLILGPVTMQESALFPSEATGQLDEEMVNAIWWKSQQGIVYQNGKSPIEFTFSQSVVRAFPDETEACTEALQEFKKQRDSMPDGSTEATDAYDKVKKRFASLDTHIARSQSGVRNGDAWGRLKRERIRMSEFLRSLDVVHDATGKANSVPLQFNGGSMRDLLKFAKKNQLEFFDPGPEGEGQYVKLTGDAKVLGSDFLDGLAKRARAEQALNALEREKDAANALLFLHTLGETFESLGSLLDSE